MGEPRGCCGVRCWNSGCVVNTSMSTLTRIMDGAKQQVFDQDGMLLLVAARLKAKSAVAVPDP